MGSQSSLSSYCLLKMGMKEVEKSNRKKFQTKTLKSDQNSSKSDPKSTPDVILMDEVEPKQKETPPDNKKKSSGNQKGNPPVTKKQKADYNVPVFIYGDIYCALCDAHMNSEDMWKSHVAGKRHMKNLKKGDRESKYEDLNVESSIKYELRNVKDAIVGLSYVQETRKREIGVPPLYTCFLCQSNFATTPMVIEHVISMKHRLNYIKENSPDDYQLLDATNLKKPQLEPLVTELAIKLEEKFGSGTVKVKQEKGKLLLPHSPLKRPIAGDADMMERAPKSQKRFNVWKPVGYPENNSLNNVKDCRIIIEERRKRSATSLEESEVHKQRQPLPKHSKRHRSPSPYSRESSKRERTYSRSSHSPYSRESSKRERTYSRSSHSPYSRESSKRERTYSRSSHSPYSRESSKRERTYSRSSNSPYSRESSKRERTYSRSSHSSEEDYSSYSRSPSQESPKLTNSSRKVVYSTPDDKFHSRSPELEQKDISFNETESQQPEADNDALRNVCLKLFALPAVLYLKLANLKMQSLDENGVDDLGDLEDLVVKVIKKAQAKFCENFPSDLQDIANEKMLPETESNLLETIASPNGNSQATASSSKENADLSFLSELINQAKRKVPTSPVSSNAPPYPRSVHGNINPLPHGNSASSTMASPGIPGLTSGHR